MRGSRAGEVLDRYRIERLLGEGGFGEVYLARHVLMDRVVALKVLHREAAQDNIVRERFLREAQAAAAVGHRAVVQVLDCGITDQGEAFLVMEYLEGEDLASLLKRVGPLAWERAIPIVLEVLDALHAVHGAGVVHRDLKPANIFLPKRTPETVKILDFGISKLHGIQKLTGTGTVLGTPHYMAPESFFGVSQVDEQADVYSVAAMLYEMLSGDPPHDADTYEQLVVKVATTEAPSLAKTMPSLPAHITSALSRGLMHDLADRWQTARRFHDALGGDTPVRRSNEIAPVDPLAQTTAGAVTEAVKTVREPFSRPGPAEPW